VVLGDAVEVHDTGVHQFREHGHFPVELVTVFGGHVAEHLQEREGE